MHKKNTQRWLKSTSLSVILAVLFGGLFAQSVRAVISNPTPICVGSTCTLTFDATGDYYLWTPPTGAKNISFDLMGAQGGRTGGLGGRVQGSFITPPSSLYIYVGGAGLSGAGAAGGFNGGGAAGGSRGDEGSGGGATDIRSTTSLNDRIVVAAGGGGTGGFFGGAGGAGGGLTGNAGTSGQGQGGQAGTPTSGGNGGSPNGGTWGTAGGFGTGGVGGTSSTSGGGGGGGGYYGGGGGGADIDGCCTNGGGGGGGSSWNNASLTTSVVHTAGYRSGAGVAVISYVMPPSVTTFAPSTALTNANSISYNLIFNESISGLTNSDFATTGSTATCSSVSISGSGSNYLVTASNCSEGSYRLSLLANSVSGTVPGPTADFVSTDVSIERTIPTVTTTSPLSPTSALSFEYGLLFSESVTGLAADDFVITGSACEIGSVSATATSSVTRYTVQVIRCADGASVGLRMNANAVSDTAMNLGPASVTTFTTVTVNRGTLAAAPIAPSPTPTASAPAGSNSPGSNSPVSSPTNSNPTNSNPSAPAPTAPSVPLGSAEPKLEPTRNQSGVELVASQPVRKTYAFTQAIKLPTNPDEEPTTVYQQGTNQITIDNPTDDPPITKDDNWQDYAIIGVGSVAGLLSAVGIAKGMRQMRNRRLVRKFA